MQKLNITKSISVACFDEKDYISQNQKIYDDIKNILSSFDDDPLLTEAKDYVDNLNGDIFLTGKKVDIFLLKQNTQAVSFLIVEDDELKTIWTHFDFLKLGYATILLRAFAILQKSAGKTKIKCKVDDKNLVAENLFDSFSKVENIVVNKSNADNKTKIEYSFDFENIDEQKLLKDVQQFAI